MKNVTSLSSEEVRFGSGAMFDRIAGRYDLLNRLISLGLDRGWRRAAVASLNLQTDIRILDLATGTGDLALEVVRQCPTARVVGIDPSAGMLELGREKVQAAALEQQIEMRLGKAEELPLEDDSVDGVVIGFGIRNVADRAAGLREMARVTRPGGRVTILEGSEPKSGILAPFARFYLHYLMPRIGAWLSRAPEYRYLQSSIEDFPNPKQFAQDMRQAGLEVLEVKSFGFGACHLYVASPLGGQP